MNLILSISFVSIALSSTMAAILLRNLFFKKSRFSLMQFHACMVVLPSVYIYVVVSDMPFLYNALNVSSLGSSLFLGVILGLLWFQQERLLLAFFSKNQKARMLDSNTIAKKFNVRDNSLPVSWLSLLSLWVIAFGEELFYRAFGLTLALSSNHSFFVVLIVLATSFCFAIMHYPYGVISVTSKFIFSLILFILLYVTGSIILPIISHLVFNTKVWKQVRI